MPSNKNKRPALAVERSDRGPPKTASKRTQLLEVRHLLSEALALIQYAVGDAETLAHLRDALAELDAELEKG